MWYHAKYGGVGDIFFKLLIKFIFLFVYRDLLVYPSYCFSHPCSVTAYTAAGCQKCTGPVGRCIFGT